MKTIIQKYKIEPIINYFVEGFEPKKGSKIVSHEYNYDAHKGEVMLTLYICDESESERPTRKK